jgi:hypothetical protein
VGLFHAISAGLVLMALSLIPWMWILVLLHYDGGLEKAIRSFQQETGLNLAHPIACQVLRDRFEDEKAKGPVAYASFCLIAWEWNYTMNLSISSC